LYDGIIVTYRNQKFINSFTNKKTEEPARPRLEINATPLLLSSGTPAVQQLKDSTLKVLSLLYH